MKRSLGLLPLATLVGACSGPGNTGRPESNPDLLQIPWANHVTPEFAEGSEGSLGAPKVSAAPYYPPIGDNLPDPGSRPIDCSVLDDIELSPYWVDTFEPYAPGMNPTTGQPYWGVATAWASYDDGTKGSFRTPGDVGWYSDLGGGIGVVAPYDHAPRATWGMAADRHPAEVKGEHTGVRPECGGAPNEFVLHYRGGRFNYYGGGFAHPLSPPVDGGLVVPEDGQWILTEPCPPGSDLCAKDPDIFVPRGKDVFEKTRHGYWDVSAYDGVTFWARRGPDGGSSVLVGFQDKHTSQDLNSESEQFCKRHKECKAACTNGFSCVDDVSTRTDPIKRCMPEGYDIALVGNPALAEFLFPPCGQNICTPPVFNPDPDFNNTTCEALSFTGLESNYWCTGPDRPVPPPAERCGDGFVSRVTLSTDWQLYKIPFDQFRQAGNGKPAPFFDLETVHSIFFELPVGWADIYVDDVSFYRQK